MIKKPYFDNQNQEGVGILETLLIVTVTCVLGAIGWYAFHTKHQTDQILNQAQKEAQNIPSKASKNSTQKYSQAYCKDNRPFSHSDLVTEIHATFISYNQATNIISYKNNDNGTSASDGWCTVPRVEDRNKQTIGLADLKSGDIIYIDTMWSGIISIYQK
jgi:hypothetical protein